MVVIVTLDENGGMMFNHRRQSQDVILRQRVLALSKGSVLWMNAYTAKQFGEQSEIKVSESFLSEAETGEYCFAENTSVAPYEQKIESIIVYKWNRAYPHDTIFDVNLSDWHLTSIYEFAGKSHTKITEEVYRK